MEMKRLKEMQERAAIEQERQRLREEEEAKGDEEILKVSSYNLVQFGDLHVDVALKISNSTI